MSSTDTDSSRSEVLIISPGAGRRYSIGDMQAVFKADGPETSSRYSISEWWLESGGKGPGGHSHSDDHIFYVIEGTLTLTFDDRSTDAENGTYIIIPGGVRHDFENGGSDRCGFISINVPGGFETSVQEIVRHFTEGGPAA
jgi:mannose-6-phosphate isomerase-like protein (cupin superfamily)